MREFGLSLRSCLGREGDLVMVANGDRPANETFEAYKSAAAKAAKNVPAANIQGGSFGSLPAANAVAPPV